MKKILSIILILAITTICLSGCSDKTKPDADNPVTLTMWHVYGSQTKSPLNDAIDEFNDTVGRENGVTVNVVSVTSSSAIDKALSASANGERVQRICPTFLQHIREWRKLWERTRKLY